MYRRLLGASSARLSPREVRYQVCFLLRHCLVCAVRTVRADEAELCGLLYGRMRDASSDTGPPCGKQLRTFFAGLSWAPHVAAHGLGSVAGLRCCQRASSWSSLSGTSCAEWVQDLPASAESRRTGRAAADFGSVLRRRKASLPWAPD